MNNNGKYLQYGCGHSAPLNWRNFDASPTLRFERIPLLGQLYTKNASRFPQNVEFGDVVVGLPVIDSSVKAVYCSHVLEHLALEDFRKALANTHKMLISGGCFRFVLPDLEFSIKKYCDDSSANAASLFMRETSLGKVYRSRGLTGFIGDWFGNSQHFWMWDYKAIAQELENAGYTNIRRAAYGDAEDIMFEAVEDKQRWENCLGVECTKP